MESQCSTYLRAKSLNDFNGDPEKEPFKSKYEARVLFQNIRDCIHNQREDNYEEDNLVFKEAAIEYHLGINYIYSEEIPAGQERLGKVFELCVGDRMLSSKAAGIVVAAHNEMGLVWSNREDGITKAHEHLLKAEEIYQEYKAKCDEAPYTLDDHFITKEANEFQRSQFFENLHTYTLYYLAQVHKSLGNGDESASYCMKTLRRQLEFRTYKPMEWGLNCACLSQYFITKNMFLEGKHCLSCANFIMGEVTQENDELENKLNETLADIARCWVKYCLCLLTASKEKVESMDTEANSQQQQRDSEDKSYERFSLEVTMIEEKVPHEYCTDYEQAKAVFLLGKDYASRALKHFVLDGFVTDFVEIKQDISRLFQNVAFFEANFDLRCRMYKRRIDLLIPVLNELNPQFYLAVCRQLQFELAEIYNDMMDMKLQRYNSSTAQQTVHARKKINMLSNSSIKYFHEFLKSLHLPNGKFPDRFESDVERPALIAHFYIARLYSKLFPKDAQEKLDNLKMSLSFYSFITTYVNVNEEAADCVEKEIEICRDMVEVLPKTLDQFITTIENSSRS